MVEYPITFLRALPTMTFYLTFPSGILAGISSDILFGVSSGILSGTVYLSPVPGFPVFPPPMVWSPRPRGPGPGRSGFSLLLLLVVRFLSALLLPSSASPQTPDQSGTCRESSACHGICFCVPQLRPRSVCPSDLNRSPTASF